MPMDGPRSLGRCGSPCLRAPPASRFPAKQFRPHVPFHRPAKVPIRSGTVSVSCPTNTAFLGTAEDSIGWGESARRTGQSLTQAYGSKRGHAPAADCPGDKIFRRLADAAELAICDRGAATFGNRPLLTASGRRNAAAGMTSQGETRLRPARAAQDSAGAAPDRCSGAAARVGASGWVLPLSEIVSEGGNNDVRIMDLRGPTPFA